MLAVYSKNYVDWIVGALTYRNDSMSIDSNREYHPRSSQGNGYAMPCNMSTQIWKRLRRDSRTPVEVASKPRCNMSRFTLFILLHELHKGLLVHETSIVPILKDAEVSEAKFGETLVDQVDRRVHIQRNWCLWGLANIHNRK